MVYVCSDIHGEYQLLLQLLQKIRFSPSDEMIVCGDVIDKGSGSVRLLKLLAQQSNFTFILGNHEYDFLKYYHALMMNEQTDYDDVLAKLQACFPCDGLLLDWATVDWLDLQPFFVERESFVCVHSGIPLLPNNTLLCVKSATAEQLVYDRKFKNPSLLPQTEKCVFFGHTPSNYLTGKHEIILYPKVQNPVSVQDFTKIHLDVGSWLGGGVACFCVETLQTFYCKKA